MSESTPEIDDVLEPESRDEQQPTDEELSQGPSGLGDPETSQGGADAVPDTPDGVPEDFT